MSDSSNTPKFTPAPWKAKADRKNIAPRFGLPMALVITGAGSTAIDCTGSAGDYDGDRANAHLIAAAPDLYAALNCLAGEVRASLGIAEHEIRQAVGNTNLACLQRRVEQALVALAKARGEQ